MLQPCISIWISSRDLGGDGKLEMAFESQNRHITVETRPIVRASILINRKSRNVSFCIVGVTVRPQIDTLVWLYSLELRTPWVTNYEKLVQPC